MLRYYTRVCNFYYGQQSKILVKNKKSLPLHNIKEISFDQIEIITSEKSQPSPLWQRFAVTTKVKSQLKRFFRSRENET